MKITYALFAVLFFLSSQSFAAVEGDFTQILLVHQKLCSTQSQNDYEKKTSKTTITPRNLLSFIEDPYLYVADYRALLDEQFFIANGGIDNVTRHASKMANSKEDIQKEIKAMLRWNARKPIVSLQYTMCANTLALYEITDSIGCQNNRIALDQFEETIGFCKDPFKY